MDQPPKKDRRINPDRRKKPTNAFTIKTNGLSRKLIRRKEDREKSHYVDLYSLRSILAVFSVLALSVADAILTLILVSKGKAKEANPFMDFFLQQGPIPFLAVKYFVTGACLIWFLIHKDYFIFKKRGSVKTIFVIFLFLYLILIFYEIYLIMV